MWSVRRAILITSLMMVIGKSLAFLSLLQLKGWGGGTA